MHRRIWRVAEATVDDALADLSAHESAQLMQLLSRVKKTLVGVVEEGRTNGNGNGATVARVRTPRENGRAAP